MLKLIVVLAVIALPVLAPSVRAAMPRLRADGIRIVDPDGREVRMHGINLGGWFLEEMWMTPFVQDPPAGSSFALVHDSVSLWKTIGDRLGQPAVQSVKAAWRDNWVTEADLKRVRDAGFDHVRLPFIYDLPDEAGGMDRLRKAVRWANDAGLYVVLDMHGTPGRQSNDHTTGQQGINKFFYEPANVEMCVKIWARLAREFGRNPGVAAFDLINEPTGAPNPATLHLVYNRLYQAVRKAAPDTMVIIDDGYKGFDTTPHADVAGWTNVVYSLHFYQFDAKSTEDHVKSLEGRLPKVIELRGYRNAPVYIGEFNVEPFGTPATMAGFTKGMTDAGLSWAVWTYKTVARGGPMGFWGLYSKPGPADALNPFTDSVDEMKAKLAQVRTENLTSPEGLLSTYQAAGRAASAVPR